MAQSATISAHPAELYNRIRRIIMSQANKDAKLAKHWLSGYKAELGNRGFSGLNAELEFFIQHGRDYRLIPALDSGDATDFAGEMNGRMFRIDVTTNMAFKKLETYEPYQTNGALYKLALFADGKFEIIDINFPFCPKCNIGRVFSFGILHGPNHRNGALSGTNDQAMIEVCGSCGEYTESARTTSFNFDDFDAFSRSSWERLGLDDDLNDADPQERARLMVRYRNAMQSYATDAMRYLKTEFGTPLLGVGSPGYKVTGRRGDGHYAVDPSFVDGFVSGRFRGEFEFRFDDLPDRAKTA